MSRKVPKTAKRAAPKKSVARRIGRPVKAPQPGERVSLGLRVTAEIKQKLDRAAEESGRSQSQEAELRMERSFIADEGRKEREATLRERSYLIIAQREQIRRLAALAGVGDRWEFYTDKKGEHHWRRVAPDFEIVGQSEKGYVTKEESFESARQAGWQGEEADNE